MVTKKYYEAANIPLRIRALREEVERQNISSKSQLLVTA